MLPEISRLPAERLCERQLDLDRVSMARASAAGDVAELSRPRGRLRRRGPAEPSSAAAWKSSLRRWRRGWPEGLPQRCLEAIGQ